MATLLQSQLTAVVVTIILATVATTIIGFALKVTIGLRPTADVETAGLDVAEHGEEGYIL